MSHPFDFLVFIGRFQPFHLGHLAVVQAGLLQAAHLIVLCGSASQPRSLRNPFTWQERAEMIRNAVTPADSKRLLIVPV
ncbi:MAG TPA: adenylyltransferase/cytidyltransferase family protein, partial [Dongiaceae bacterium]|nr:adenylyltransferase/cytidyltransferase family protein [Dongiaceae bacterium]